MVENGDVVPYGILEPTYSTDILARQAAQFIAEAASDDRPFLAYISTAAPHFPWNPAPRHRGLFAGVEIWLPPSFYEADVSDKPLFVRSLQVDFIQMLGTQSVRKLQLEMMLSVNQMVTALMDQLEDMAIADDTIVIYTSDNGQAWGEHRWKTKGCPWEECLRVPLIIRYPRLAPLARAEERMALNIDLAPTLAELAGIEPPEGRDGTSLVRVIDATAREWREDFFVESLLNVPPPYVIVRDERWKYVQYAHGEHELYDLESDPWELENRAYDADQAERVDSMTQRLGELWPGWESR
jgi:arylsulfatase A-like enzyme